MCSCCRATLTQHRMTRESLISTPSCSPAPPTCMLSERKQNQNEAWSLLRRALALYKVAPVAKGIFSSVFKRLYLVKGKKWARFLCNRPVMTSANIKSKITAEVIKFLKIFWNLKWYFNSIYAILRRCVRISVDFQVTIFYFVSSWKTHCIIHFKLYFT